MTRSEAGLTNRELAAIYAQYGHLVLRRCRVLLRDDALADDALQNAFVKVLKYGQAYRAADAPLRWLYRVADRCCFDLLDKRRRRAEVPPPPREHAAPPGVDVAARDAILTFLHRLGDKDRQIAVLTWVDGLSQGEIAAVTGWSRQTINKKTQRLRARAEIFWRRHG